jgi:hypothetical protein
MSKLRRLLDWLMPGLIYLSPMGALAYYTAGAEQEPSQHELPRVEERALVFDALTGPRVISLARI